MGIDPGISGVHTGPGATALTRTPCSIASPARPLVKPSSADLVTAYGSSVGVGS